MAIDQSFFIERQGRKMVLYAGLLQEAHEKGLREIKTTLHQIPTPENGNVAIVHARVVMDHLSEPHNPLRNSFGAPYSDGDHPRIVERAFEGFGDASPENVGRNIVPHLVRMSETRAKARALRDAVNVGVTALEEIADEAPEPNRSTASPQRGSRGQQQENRKLEAVSSDDLPATKKQLGYLASLVDDVYRGGREKFAEMNNKPIEEFTRAEVSAWIAKLSGRTG